MLFQKQYDDKQSTITEKQRAEDELGDCSFI